MGAIGPGDWVECVEVYGVAMREVGFVERGLYIVVACGEWSGVSTGYWISVAGVASPSDFGAPMQGWDADCFRPIYRPKQEIIEALKQPAPAEPVPA